MKNNYSPGYVLSRPKGFASHKGIYVGNGYVYHITSIMPPHIVPLHVFADGQKVSVDSRHEYNWTTIRTRIEAALARKRFYNALLYNCEDVVNEAVTGYTGSPQRLCWSIIAIVALFILPAMFKRRPS
jgi:hypothetical protein